MRSPRTLITAAALGFALVLVASPSASSAAPSAGFKRCSNVVIRNPDGAIYTRTNGLFQRNSSCTMARKVARKFLIGSEGADTPKPYGFRCNGGEDGVSCKKGKQSVTWGYYSD